MSAAKRYRAVTAPTRPHAHRGTTVTVTTYGFYDDLPAAVQSVARQINSKTRYAAVFDSETPGGPVWESP